MPSSPGYKRNYKQEWKTAKQRGEDTDNNTRHRARRIMVKRGAVKKGQDVDHIKPISKGGAGTDTKNLRAMHPSKNRSFKRTASGAIKGPR